MLIERHPRHLS
jgi:hypothetical protein